MLAQNFKSATDLRISEEQRRALELTLSALERGELRHVTYDPLQAAVADDVPFTAHFNMNAWRCVADCGTVCCIGGTAEFLGNLPLHSFDRATEKNRALSNLFFPPIHGWDEITADQAATALRSYLTTGDAKWAEALEPQ